MLRVGDLLLTLSERGKLSLAAPRRSASSCCPRANPSTPTRSGPPRLLYNGRLYVKAGDEFVSLDLGRQ